MDAHEILDREFLDIRAKLLEVAAAFDRIDRASGDVSEDARMEKIREAIHILHTTSDSAERAEKIQLLFSRPYDSSWLGDFQVKARS